MAQFLLATRDSLRKLIPDAFWGDDPTPPAASDDEGEDGSEAESNPDDEDEETDANDESGGEKGPDDGSADSSTENEAPAAANSRKRAKRGPVEDDDLKRLRGRDNPMHLKPCIQCRQRKHGGVLCRVQKNHREPTAGQDHPWEVPPGFAKRYFTCVSCRGEKGPWVKGPTHQRCGMCMRAYHAECGDPPGWERCTSTYHYCERCWEQGFEAPCKICKAAAEDSPGDTSDSDEELQHGASLLCDICDDSFHVRCLRPRPKVLPEGLWQCKICTKIPEPDISDVKPDYPAPRERARTQAQAERAEGLPPPPPKKPWKEFREGTRKLPPRSSVPPTAYQWAATRATQPDAAEKAPNDPSA